MSFLDYFKEKYIFIIINLVALTISFLILRGLNVDSYAVIFICVLNFLASSIFYFYDYFNKRKYYKGLLDKLEHLDKKYFITDVASEGEFLESGIFYQILEEATKSMKDDISEAIRNSNEYKEYIEIWVHEIKTPIATCKLIIENNENKITNSIADEINRVEQYIEQVLFYARSNTIEKDYLIRAVNLRDIVNTVIRRNSNVLIENQVKIELYSLDKIVYCDSKWVEFILGQIISNSIKYMDKKKSILKIYCEDIGEDIILNIYDNGIGMDEKCILKAFEKGYTGENGRRFGKSTGIGLYLCKKLCDKLGLSIKIESQKNNGTRVSILFPINKIMKF